MNLKSATMNDTVSEWEARKAFLAYRSILREKRTEEDEALMRSYREIAAGKQVISIHSVMQGAGLDDAGLPNLAIARADLRFINLTLWGNGAAWFFITERCKATQVKLPGGTFGQNLKPQYNKRAIVPTIPAHLRPPHDLSNYHILWDADWKQVPHDPALLKHLGAGMYAVLAVWDLTPLEKQVLAMTRGHLPR